MKFIYSIVCLSLLFVGCQPKVDNSANEAFEKNSQTVLANLEGFQNENVDYSQYAKDFVMRDTGFGAADSVSLEEMMDNDKQIWGAYDFKVLDDPIVLLPGVNVETKLADGSVRLYADWEVSRPATDSTEAKSGVIKLYESYDFDDEGKILFQQAYADFTGLMMYLNSKDDVEEETKETEE